RIAGALAGPRRLLVLDNAEQVIAAVADVETLIAANDALRVLVTSREPLRIAPEAVFRVDPLDVPAANADDADTLARSAVRLFFSRANALQRTPGVQSAEIRVAGEICRRLDGIPLAIELAAARAATLGLEGVYRRLDDRLAMLGGGHRTALPRHQTLRATFDWSFALLDRRARAVFRRLAMFGGLFTFDAMCAVACDADLTIGGVIAAIDELVAKSLVTVEFDGPVAKYRLPESTRAYALEKLIAEGERHQIAARHARYLTACFDAAPAGSARARFDDASALRQTLDDARSAFDWAFSDDGNPRVGIELAASLVGALLDGGMIDECGKRAALAVDAIDALPPRSVDAAVEMRVRAALAASLLHLGGPVPRSAALWRDVLALAVESGDAAHHARALWGLWNAMLSAGDIDESLRYAMRFQALSQQHGTRRQQILGEQLVAVSLHCQGRHSEAKARLEDALRCLA
ncbi:transcriptional regulator, partial [Burkholderia oklahomensis]|uniref:ATP-binding protein n=1 Tax=Burkholderia oklahomensis TaxID=342113 RepID=UPI00016A8251